MLSSLQLKVEAIKKNLEVLEERRETLIKGTRDILIYCSKSIVSLHNGEIKSADQFINRADESLKNLKNIAGADLQRYLSTAEQEFVEAKTFYCIIQEQFSMNLVDLNVS